MSGDNGDGCSYLRRLWRVFPVLVIALLLGGCITPKRTNLIVPARCMKVDSQSFTRPCTQRADGKLLCDGVVVTATCVRVSR
jgi:hypothetical protein